MNLERNIDAVLAARPRMAGKKHHGTTTKAKQVMKWAKPHLKKKAKKAKGTLLWGFKRVHLGLDGFKALFKSIGASLKPRKVTKKIQVGDWYSSKSYKYHWKGRGATIVTDDNPLTGEFGGEIRDDHLGYAHYMGLTGKHDAVKRAVSYIKRHNAHGKYSDESPGRRGFI
jgi:hypothetical protein